MKWRDMVKMAIMHGPLSPDVTLDVPHWWQPGMPLLRPTDYVAPVPLKRKRVMSVESKTDLAKRAFVDFHAFHARVHGKTYGHSIRRAKQLVPVLFGPWRLTRSAGGMTAAHPKLTAPADRPWNCHLSPFRLANLTHAVAAMLGLSVPSWQRKSQSGKHHPAA